MQLLLDKVDDGRSILDSLTIQEQDMEQQALSLKLAEVKGQGSTVPYRPALFRAGRDGWPVAGNAG